HSDWSAEVNITQSQHEIARSKDDVAHVIRRLKAVDTADEFDVVGAPGCIRSHRAHVALDGLRQGRIIERQRQPYGARGNLEVVEIAHTILEVSKRAQQSLEG